MNKVTLFVSIFLWLFLGINYLNRTVYFQRSHDVLSHVDCVKYIAKENKLPTIKISAEAQHPPLYYLLMSKVAKGSLLSSNKDFHLFLVRSISVFLGAFAVFFIWWLIQEFNLPYYINFIVLTYIFTNPKFVFIFSTYNNDSLGTLLSIIVITFTYKLSKKWNFKNAIFLLLFSTLAVYTKFSFMFVFASLIIILAISYLRCKSPQLIKISLILIMSVMSLFPYLYFHNYKSTGKLISTVAGAHSFKMKHTVSSYFKNLSTRIKIPMFNNLPFVWVDYVDGKAIYNYHDFFTVSFITSVIGECVYFDPSKYLIWTILWIHLLFSFFALLEARKNIQGLTSILFIVLMYIMHVLPLGFLYDFRSCFYDYRIIASSWLVWAVLYGNLIKNLIVELKILALTLMLLVTILHVYLLSVCETNF